MLTDHEDIIEVE